MGGLVNSRKYECAIECVEKLADAIEAVGISGTLSETLTRLEQARKETEQALVHCSDSPSEGLLEVTQTGTRQYACGERGFSRSGSHAKYNPELTCNCGVPHFPHRERQICQKAETQSHGSSLPPGRPPEGTKTAGPPNLS